jgi:hypothetical protein
MSTRDAVIVSTARTAIGKAYRGAFNATPSPTLAAHAIRAWSMVSQPETPTSVPTLLRTSLSGATGIRLWPAWRAARRA